MNAPHLATPRPVVLAHGSLRHADFRDRVAAVARARFDGLGLHVREYARLLSQGWSDADLRAVLTDAGVPLVEIETLLGWDDPPERRDPDGLRREQLAFALADAVGARHAVAVGAITGDLRPSATEGFTAPCDRAAEHGLLVAARHRDDRAGIGGGPVRPERPAAARDGGRGPGDGFVFGSASPHTPQRAGRLRELLATHGRDPDTFVMDTMIDYSLGPPAWAEQTSAWAASGGSIRSIRTMSTGARYHGVPDVQVAGPAAHIAALGEFLRVVRA